MRYISSTLPRHLSKDVPLDTTIEVMFMRDISLADLKEEYVILFDLDSQISIPIKFEYKRRVLTITPKIPLNPLSHYQVDIIGGEEGIKDITGQILAETYTFEFFTSDIDEIQPPNFFSPTHLSEVSSSPSFEWEYVENAEYYELQIAKTHTFQKIEWPLDDVKIYNTWFTPELSYEKGRYYARVRSITKQGVKSAYSEPIQFYYDDTICSTSEQVTTQEEKINIQMKSQTNIEAHHKSLLDRLQHHFYTKEATDANLKITKTEPKHESLHLPIEGLKEIRIQFNEDLNKETVNKDTCYVITERN